MSLRPDCDVLPPFLSPIIKAFPRGASGCMIASMGIPLMPVLAENILRFLQNTTSSKSGFAFVLNLPSELCEILQLYVRLISSNEHEQQKHEKKRQFVDFTPQVVRVTQVANRRQMYNPPASGRRVYIPTSQTLIVDLLSPGMIPLADLEGLFLWDVGEGGGQNDGFVVRVIREWEGSDLVRREREFQRSLEDAGLANSDDPRTLQLSPQFEPKKPIFVKGYTSSTSTILKLKSADAPSTMSGGDLVTLLSYLQIYGGKIKQSVKLFPRFHKKISESLASTQPKVTELHVSLGPRAFEIAKTIGAIVIEVGNELRKSLKISVNNNNNDTNVFNIWPSDVVAAMRDKSKLLTSKSLDRTLSSLVRSGRIVSQKDRALCSDLKTLRDLLGVLGVLDCVGFWKRISDVRKHNSGRGKLGMKKENLWLLDSKGERLVTDVRNRIFEFIIEDKCSIEGVSNSSPTPDPRNPYASVAKNRLRKRIKKILEPNPKWKILGEVLEEIRSKGSSNENKDGKNAVNQDSVLVMVRNLSTLRDLTKFLSQGLERHMNFKWLHFLEMMNYQVREMLTTGSKKVSQLKEEERLLVEAESQVRNQLFNENSSRNNDNNSNIQNSKKRKQQKAKNRSKQGRKKSIRRMEVERERIKLGLSTDFEAMENVDIESSESSSSSSSEEEPTQFNDTSDPYSTFCLKKLPSDKNLVTIQVYDDPNVPDPFLYLLQHRPKHIILYDADPRYVRILEAYSNAVHPTVVNLYMMLYENSVEEKQYVNALSTESDDFENLIAQKKSNVSPMSLLGGNRFDTQEEVMARQDGVVGEAAAAAVTVGDSTRDGKGRVKNDKNSTLINRGVAVDVREFKSALPQVLHSGGMRLAPVTLLVGDFVLTPEICVERKSLNDLLQSFASGRLFHQMENQSRHYQIPCLLIEFSDSNHFGLQKESEITLEITKESPISKIVLLTYAFPKMRIMWARNCQATLEIFREAKEGRDDVDVEAAMRCGREDMNPSGGDNSNGNDSKSTKKPTKDEIEADPVNETAIEMLMKLPGVTKYNARLLMEECDSLREMTNLSQATLKKCMGSGGAAKLWAFFRDKPTKL